MSSEDSHEGGSGEVMDNDIEAMMPAGNEQEVLQPHCHDVGEKDERYRGDEEDEEREEEQVVHMEQTEGEGEDHARHPARTNDGGAQGLDMRIMEHNARQGAKEL